MPTYGPRTDYIRTIRPEPGRTWPPSVQEGYLSGLHEPAYFPGLGERDPSTNQCRITDMPGPYDITLTDTPHHILLHVRSDTASQPHELRLSKAVWMPELTTRLQLIDRYTHAALHGDALSNKEANRARREHHDALAGMLHDRLSEQGADIHVHTCITLVGFLTQLYAPDLARPADKSPGR
jgi:hypothetical protein